MTAGLVSDRDRGSTHLAPEHPHHDTALATGYRDLILLHFLEGQEWERLAWDMSKLMEGCWSGLEREVAGQETQGAALRGTLTSGAE